MKNKRKFGLLLLMILMLITASCAPQSTPDINATVAVNVSAAQTIVVQTMNALASITPTDTVTPDVTATATLEPTDESSPTPQGVFLTVSKDTNCRSGQSTGFNAVYTVKVGERVQVAGQSPDKSWYYVLKPESTSSYCWVWAQYAAIEGDSEGLPVFTPQPTPTPTLTPTPKASFSISYSRTDSCSGEYYTDILLRNIGSTVWQSFQMTIVDTATSTTFTTTSNSFTEYGACGVALAQGDLSQGEYAYISNFEGTKFGYDPTGHSLSITVMVCSAKSLAGTCLTQSINVTP